MKTWVNNGYYTFNAAGQTITLDPAFTGIGEENILAVIHNPTGTTIYKANGKGSELGGSLSGLVLSLDFDTTGYANGDLLRIIYDWDGANPLPEATLVQINSNVGTTNVNIGDVTDIAVQGDVQGTVSAKLRGISTFLSDLFNSNSNWINTKVINGVSISGNVGVQDGADINAGTTTDAAVDTDTTGTMSGKLRGLVKLFVNFLSRFPSSLGQKTMANSLPVVISSDQSALPISGTITATGVATETTLTDVKTQQTDGSQKTKITDGAGVVNTKVVGNAVVAGDVGLVTHAMMHGLSSGGGGTYVDVKVTPSGALTTEINDGGGSITVDGTVTVTQGTGTNLHTVIDSGIITTITNDVGIKDNGNVISVDDAGSTLSVDDGGGSITVDGTVAATQSGTWILGANSGVDIGDVTINNASGASAVNIQDGGNSITVDGTVTVTQGTATNLKAQAEVYQGGTAVGAAAPLQVSLANTGANATAVKVDGSAVTQPVSGTQKYVRTGAGTTLTVTNLNSLASSATAGWQSARIDNTSNLYDDYLISVKLDMANTAPANDKAAYVYLCPFYYDGSTWFATDGGTATLPSGTEGTYTIANPNNLVLLGVMAYTTADMVMQKHFLVSNAFGRFMPDGFSIVIINFTGAAIAASANVVQWTGLNHKLV